MKKKLLKTGHSRVRRSGLSRRGHSAYGTGAAFPSSLGGGGQAFADPQAGAVPAGDPGQGAAPVNPFEANG